MGVALSDPEGILASPLTIVDRDGDESAIKAIIDIVTKREVGNIIVGLPHSMDGTVGAQAEKVMSFVDTLRKRTEVPIEYRDERLTSVSARRILSAGNRKAKKKMRDDAIAAAIILQSYLEEVRRPLELE